MRRRTSWSGVAAASLFGALAVLIATRSASAPLTVAATPVVAALTSAALALYRDRWAPALLLWILLPAVLVRLMTGDGTLAGAWIGAAIAGAGLLASFDVVSSRASSADEHEDGSGRL